MIMAINAAKALALRIAQSSAALCCVATTIMHGGFIRCAHGNREFKSSGREYDKRRNRHCDNANTQCSHGIAWAGRLSRRSTGRLYRCPCWVRSIGSGVQRICLAKIQTLKFKLAHCRFSNRIYARAATR
jgi:hypothetical protein